MNRTALQKVKDYAFHTGAHFTYKQIMADLGISKSTAVEVINTLVHDCDIVRIGRPREGIYKWATSAQKKKALEERRKAGLATMREHGAEFEMMMKEVI